MGGLLLYMCVVRWLTTFILFLALSTTVTRKTRAALASVGALETARLQASAAAQIGLCLWSSQTAGGIKVRTSWVTGIRAATSTPLCANDVNGTHHYALSSFSPVMTEDCH